MNGIFGVFQDSDQQTASDSLRELSAPFESWGATSYFWGESQLGLGVAVPAGLDCVRVTVDGEHGKRLAVAGDIRLDNFETLRSKLDCYLKHAAPCPEEIILAAHRHWGESAPEYLLGDFVYALWDEEQGKAVLARDQIGVKCIYYHLGSGRLLFSNHLASLAVNAKESNVIDAYQAEDYLRHGYCHHPERTFYSKVKRLPPGAIAVFSLDGGRFEQRQYWSAENVKPVRLKSEDLYFTQLRELLQISVEDRVRGECQVYSHLSGGLDSSSIAVIAARFLKSRDARLHAYNWNNSARTDSQVSPEWALADELATLEGIEQLPLTLDANELAKVFMELNIGHDHTTDLWYEHSARDHIASRGGGIVLSGWGGDELISAYGTGWIEELASKGKILKSYRTFCSQVAPENRHVLLFLRYCLRAAACAWFPASYYRFKEARHRNKSPLPPYLLLEVKGGVRLAIGDEVPHSKASVRKHQLSLLRGGHIQQRLQACYAAGLESGVEYRFPLLDRRIVEYALAVPSSLYLCAGQDRYLFRQAITGIVPEAIRLHADKNEPLRISHFHRVVHDALKLAIRARPPESSPYVNAVLLEATVEQAKFREEDDLRTKLAEQQYPLSAYLFTKMCKSN